jgi:hypothetical protein
MRLLYLVLFQLLSLLQLLAARMIMQSLQTHAWDQRRAHQHERIQRGQGLRECLGYPQWQWTNAFGDIAWPIESTRFALTCSSRPDSGHFPPRVRRCRQRPR